MNTKVLLIIFFSFFLVSCQGTRPSNLGLKMEKKQTTLSPCPDSPNCVISFKDLAGKDKNYLEPIKVYSSQENAKRKIEQILNSLSEAKIIKNEGDYIYAEFTTSIMRFIDDVEFYFGEEGFVHFRSASRVGHYDFGKNRKRIEDIRFKYRQTK